MKVNEKTTKIERFISFSGCPGQAHAPPGALGAPSTGLGRLRSARRAFGATGGRGQLYQQQPLRGSPEDAVSPRFIIDMSLGNAAFAVKKPSKRVEDEAFLVEKWWEIEDFEAFQRSSQVWLWRHLREQERCIVLGPAPDLQERREWFRPSTQAVLLPFWTNMT